MAQEGQKRKPRIRKQPTVREKTEQARSDTQRPRRIRKSAGKVGKPLRVLSAAGKKEYYLPLPDNRLGRFLNKRRKLLPSYFRESWQELRRVTWPGRKETLKLTLAVFIFAIVFGVAISLTDYGLDKLFRKVLLRS